MITYIIAPDKAAYLRNFVDLRTQLNSFLCVQKRNKNPWYSILNFFVAYDAIVFNLRLSFFASQAVVENKFIHGVVPNLVKLQTSPGTFLSLFSYTQYLHDYDIRLALQ